MAHCGVLEQYTTFIEKIREYQCAGDERPIEKAIAYCIKNGIQTDFLKKHRKEVLKTMTLDMTYEAQIRMNRRDAKEEGRQEGICQTYVAGMITKSNAMSLLNMSEDEFDEILKRFKKGEK